MSFAIGDVVEVIKTWESPLRATWIGRQMVVSGFAECSTATHPRPHLRIVTIPSGPPGVRSWHPNAVRKINPPDWSAPLATAEPTASEQRV